MSDIFFEEMQIPKPNYFLGIGGKSHGAMTGQMIEKIEKVVISEKPDWMMVYGDTNSTLAGAIVASKLHVKLAHIEAGLRSFNLRMPEEINRILTDRVSSVLFCPTDTAIRNLKNEGYENLQCKIVKSGDVMQDGAIFYKSLSKKPNIEINKNFILCTIHRPENTDDEVRLKSILEALNEIAMEKQVLLPLHPRTRKIIDNLKLNVSKLKVIDPVGYLEMVWLIDNCKIVMTDSGGLQKEAYFFNKQCITLRDQTEWVELVEHGVNFLAGAKKDEILNIYHNLNDFTRTFDRLNLYGAGNASSIITKNLVDFDR
jgi:UDP-GlcNAc3NAcA epimerase